MKILYVSNGGFGDASWSTSWPRLFTERGHEIDVFLMFYTGNPFYANPFIQNIFSVHYMRAAVEIVSVINSHYYDMILIPETTAGGVREVIEATKDVKNVHVFKRRDQSQFVSGLEIPPLTKPEWFYEDKEFKYVKNLKINNSVLFHPLSSSVYEKSRNIDFNLIIECSKKLENIVVIYGGRKYLPINDLKRMEAVGIRLLWEDYNCFNDESGTALGKFLALTSQCQVGIHAWSGSFTLSMGYNKPYVMVVPEYKIRANQAAPYKSTKKLYEQGIFRAKKYGCLIPSAWCITDKAEIIIEAVNHVLAKKTGNFDKTWTFI